MWKPTERTEDEQVIELDTMAEVDDARAAGLEARLRGAGHQTVHGLDLTFSAPKSVSTLFAVGDADIQQRAIAAHEWAVDEALKYMEREAARVVRGHKASRKELEKDSGADTLTTHRAQGFVAIKYRHRMNRLQDPHLHTHVVVGNYAQGPDGRWTALAAQHIYEHAKAGGHVYQTILRAKMRELFPWVEWGEVENGMAEFSPELMHPDLLKHFSQRSQDIEAYVQEYMHVTNPGDSSRGVRQYAWRKTRGPKPAPMSAIEEQDWRADIATTPRTSSSHGSRSTRSDRTA
jgi:conjugative relaxase-like TrwC/TraI family protein